LRYLGRSDGHEGDCEVEICSGWFPSSCAEIGDEVVLTFSELFLLS